MFTRKPPPKTKLDVVIEALLDRMAEEFYDAVEYAKMVEQLSKLYKLKEINVPKRPSPDTLLLIAGNLIGIVLILGYEQKNVITSKAIGFVLRLK